MNKIKWLTAACSTDNHDKCPGYHIVKFPHGETELREIVFCYCPCCHQHITLGELARIDKMRKE